LVRHSFLIVAAVLCLGACGGDVEPEASAQLVRVLDDFRLAEARRESLQERARPPADTELRSLERAYERMERRTGRTVVTGFSRPEQDAWHALYGLAQTGHWDVADVRRALVAAEGSATLIEIYSRTTGPSGEEQLAAALDELRLPSAD
jgi:hypothetical protein